MAIPKILVQTIQDKSKIEAVLSDNISHLKTLNPDWDYRLYENEEFPGLIRSIYGQDMLAYFDRIDPIYGAARADLFRYLLMYEHGGVYLDIKSTVTRHLSELISDDHTFLLSKWRNKKGESYEDFGLHPNIDGVTDEYQQWHIITRPKHPFLKAVIEKVKENIDRYDPVSDDIGKRGVLKLTGPIAYTSAIEKVRHLHDHNIVDIEALGFQYSVVPPATGQKYGHVALYSKHYSNQVVPIIKPTNIGIIYRIIIDIVTASRGFYKFVKRSAQSALGRS